MRDLFSDLTSKQLRWVDEYLIDLNGAAAAVRAGYSSKSARSIAHENLTKPDIQAVIHTKQAALAQELYITRQNVIQGLLEAIEMGRHQRNPAAVVGALREIAKLLGLYEPEVKRVALTSDQRISQHHISAMTDAELLALMQGRHALA